MKILVLTSLNPVLNQEPYQKLTRMYAENDDVLVLSYPFLADVRAKTSSEMYIPTLFAMMKTMVLDDDTRAKVMDKEKVIVVGNSMKDEKFDYIIAYQSAAVGDIVFDTYIEQLKEDPEIRAFFNIDDLYDIEDAEIVLPTIEHLTLFLEGVIKNDE